MKQAKIIIIFLNIALVSLQFILGVARSHHGAEITDIRAATTAINEQNSQLISTILFATSLSRIESLATNRQLVKLPTHALDNPELAALGQTAHP